jgi:hypothetical protein
MKAPIHLLRECAPALCVFLLLTLFSAFAAFGQSDDRVVIKGRLLTPEGNTEIPHACLRASNGEEMDVVIRANGRFWVNAPEQERYTLSFGQNGSLTKEVVVDANHAAKGVKGSRDRMIQFDVVLQLDESDGQLRYDGAVGKVAFHHSNGRMKVNRNYHLVSSPTPDLAAEPTPK